MSTSVDDGVIEVDDDSGIDVLLCDDDSPGLASHLSTPRDNGAIDLDNGNGIDTMAMELMSSSSTIILLDSALLCLLRVTMIVSSIATTMEPMRLRASLLDSARF